MKGRTLVPSMPSTLRRLLATTLALVLILSATLAAAEAASPLATTSHQPVAALAKGGSQPLTGPTWHQPYPNYTAVKMRSATDGWAVGDGGIIRHYNGGGWQEVASPVNHNLRAVDSHATNDIWAVGDHSGLSTIIHSDGGPWQQVVAPAQPQPTDLLDVDMTGLGQGWILGSTIDELDQARPMFLNKVGPNWAVLPTPAIMTGAVEVRQMSATSQLDFWVVAEVFTDTNTSNNTSTIRGLFPYAFHFQDYNWTAVRLGNSNVQVRSIFMLNANEGWIGLANNSGGDSVLHYDGTSWQPVAGSGGSDVTSIFALASNDYYAATTSGTSFGFRHNNNSFNVVASLKSISGVAANDIWADGADGLLYHWTGSNINLVAWGASGSEVKMLAPNDGWLNSYSRMYQYNGVGWLDTGVGAGTLDFLANNDGWKYTSYGLPVGRFSHYDGITWTDTLQGFNSSYHLQAMQMTGADSGWAVGSYYTDVFHPQPIYARYQAGSWTMQLIEPGLEGRLSSLSFTSPTNGWAVGLFNSSANVPLLYHFDGTSWQRVNLNQNGFVPFAISAASDNDVWIGGQYQRMLHWDGNTWTSVSVPFDAVDSLKMLSANNGWATTSSFSLEPATIAHYDGISWQVVYTPTTPYGLVGGTLSSLSFLNANEGWAVGDIGLMHFYDDNLPSPSPTSTNMPGSTSTSVPATPTSTATAPAATATSTAAASTATPTATPPAVSTATNTAAASTPTATAAACTISFSDVPTTSIFYGDIQFLACRGVVSGNGGLFAPSSNTTRGQFAKIVALGFGIAAFTPTTPTFTDVASSSVFYQYVEAAAHVGAITGFNDGSFRPNQNVTRAQVAVITQRVRAYALFTPTVATFSDVPASSFGYAAIETLANRSIINGATCVGASGLCFRPNDNIKRGELSKVVRRSIESQP